MTNKIKKIIDTNGDNDSLSTAEQEISVGQIYADRNARIIRIYKLKKHDKYENFEYEYLESIDPIEWRLSQYQYDGKHENRTISKSDIDSFYTLIPYSNFIAAQKNFRSFIETGDISAYQLELSSSSVDVTEIVAVGSSAQLQNMHSGLEKQKQEMYALDTLAKAHIESIKNKLESFRQKLNAQIDIVKKQMKRIMRVIMTIELYLGISEDLFQIQSGTPAPSTEPINFRQKILFMDEEVGVWTDGGYDYTNVPDFEEWLIKDKNYEKLIPEIKGMVLFKPRRRKKEYGNSRDNEEENEYNRESYFLIRNGENLYRIFSTKIQIPDRLFPLREELSKLFQELSDMMTSKNHIWERDKKEKEDKVEDMTFRYKKMAFLLQGLIDRTEIFYPLPEKKINVFDLTDNQDAVNFVYDDEIALPNGKLPFWDWHEEINKTIARGSRILITGRYSDNGRFVPKSEFHDRLFYECSEYNIPSLPSSGIYEVYEKLIITDGWFLEEDYQKALISGKNYEFLKEDPNKFSGEWDYKKQEYKSGKRKGYYYKLTTPNLAIMYNAGGTTRHGWNDYGEHERKNRISWKIYQDDKFVMNYDRIELADIEFYIHSRFDRKEYLYMLPMLFEMKKQMLDEQKQEQAFIDFLVGRAQVNNPKIDEDKCREFVNGCINWWKNKVIMKRPITKNDTLAMRMIERRVNAKKNKKVLEQDKD